ncbi:MAG: type II secretion system protein [Candidatus Omnitrophica bacterium]|nr:type II secretion system protein [Candidatus Omnitrophota bacterium]
MMAKKNKGFTLTEIIITVFIIGLLASFGLPGYAKAIQKSQERDIVTQLRAIHAANEVYRASANEYLQDGGSALNLAAINSNLNINIVPNGVTYTYSSTGISAYQAQAAWDGLTLRVTEAVLDNSNPCCVGGACLISIGSC